MQKNISLYIHLPFCEKKCFYCSFVVSIGQLHRREDYLQCLRREAERHQGEGLHSIYWGGGTPSLLTEAQMQELAGMMRSVFAAGTDVEFTVEANPEDVTLEKARLLKAIGVNRVSLGAQSFNDAHLKYLGRCHDAQQIGAAYDVLREAGFDNVNLDLMYSFPGQTLAQLEEDVRSLTALKSEHVSLYTLTVDPHSRFFAKKIKEVDSDLQADQYLRVTEFLKEAGYRQYEVSNFSKPRRESQHNVHYWHGGNYIGLGVGAHSHQDGRRWWNVSRLNDYLQRIRQGEDAEENFEELTSHQRLTETFLIGLRMTGGVDLVKLQERYGCALTSEQARTMDGFIKEGWFIKEGPRIRASGQGFLVLDRLCARLI